MPLRDGIARFSRTHAQQVPVDGLPWRYYRLGQGPPVLWLTGGLRRAALAYASLALLAERHTVIAPDYPPVRTIGAYLTALDAILQAEGVARCALAGQSYGGLLAQAYLAHAPAAVERLVLTSSGPADYGRAWLSVEQACIALARLLPERTVKNLLAGGLLRALALPGDARSEWSEVLRGVLTEELTRQDVISHFAVAADLIRRRVVVPAAYRGWEGRVIVLSAANDPTQSPKDLPRYERLFGRPVRCISLGNVGHTAVLHDPACYVRLLEEALGG